ncbi:hypothetical protein F2Q69_00050574 [Brassica cretica]|uniref:Uncharacterized protein n=1 Tax=Brassica cretica TaxID=69181 RepID=A0A8S9PPU3_BRACR|nr:hypothetical protein F2Q69_00050574 [Brassica cretica]
MEVVSSLGFRYLPSLPMTSSSNHRPHSPLKDRAPVKSPGRPIRSKRTSTSPAKKHNLSGREMLFLSLPPLSRKCSFPHRWQEGFKPDVVTVAEVLPVCSELRDIKQGKEINCYALKKSLLAKCIISHFLDGDVLKVRPASVTMGRVLTICSDLKL